MVYVMDRRLSSQILSVIVIVIVIVIEMLVPGSEFEECLEWLYSD
jgi:hypothetical protein